MRLTQPMYVRETVVDQSWASLDATIPRAATSEVRAALSDTPVVLIHGPRQAGKTTLARSVVADMGTFHEINLDDALSRSFAQDSPTDFIDSLTGPTLIDEVQRVPEIFLPIKATVDRNRRPGRFLLTGSSNILALPKLADSLAGRMAIIDLLPFAQSEIAGHDSGLLDALFGDGVVDLPRDDGGGYDLFDRILRGGFPEAWGRSADSRRDAWFSDYVRTLLERDVRDLASIEAFTQLPRLLGLLASRAGSTLNVAGISRDTGIPNTTLHRYLDMLRGVFLVHYVPAWSNNHGTRLTKSPKVYLVDTGLLGYLDNLTAKSLSEDRGRLGAILENFVATELLKLATVSARRPKLYHLRTVKQLEVDFVLEARGGDVVGIEVKSAKTVQSSDAEGLKFLKDLAGSNFRRGVILYTGRTVQHIARDIVALPIDALWRL